MDFVEQLKGFLTVYNINATDFAEKLGIQRSSISHLLSGRNKPSLDFMIKFKTAYPELKWDWLLLGNPPMLEEDNSPPALTLDIFSEEHAEISAPQKTPSKVSESEENQIVTENNTSKKIKKIVWFYSDGTFKEYVSE